MRRHAEIPVDWGKMHQRFESKLLPGPPSPDENLCPGPCWGWRGGHFKQTGYAIFNVRCADGKWRPTTAHRVAWRMYRGEFDPDLEPDHLCRNRGCVNPWHAEPVTRRVNTQRGMSPTAVLARENRCPQGHEFTEANTVRRKNGKRECRTCVRERDRKRNPGRKEHYRKMYQQRKQRQQSLPGR